MAKKNVKENSFCLLVAHGVAVPEALGESVGDVEGHGGHPAEEGNPSVLDNVAKGLAEGGSQVELVLPNIQGVVDPGGEEGEEDVEKETDGELSEQFGTVLLKEAIYNEGDKEEEGGDEDEDRVELLCLLSRLQLFFRQLESADTENRPKRVFLGLVHQLVTGIGEVDAEFSPAVVLGEVL